MPIKGPLELKKEGNSFIEKEDYEKALVCYTEALRLGRSGSDKNKAEGKNVIGTILKNRAGCYLKLVSKTIIRDISR